MDYINQTELIDKKTSSLKERNINYYKKTLIKLFEKLNTVHADPWNNLELCHNIQRTLIQKIMYLEKNVTILKTEEKNLKKELRKKNVGFQAKQRAKTYKGLLEVCNISIKKYKNIIMTFKSIGDGLAYSYLSKWDLKQFSFNSSPGYIYRKIGFKTEKKIFELYTKFNHPVILNDITNCMTYGDLTFIQQNKAIIIEAKSSDNENERTKRQLHNLELLTEYLINDESKKIAPGITVKRVPSETPEVTHMTELNELLREAKKNNSSIIKKIETGLYYSVAYTNDIPTLVAETTMTLNSEKGAKWVIWYINEYKYTNEGYFPFTLSIFSPELLFDFYSGKCIICVYANFAYIQEKLAAENIKLDFLENKEGLSLEKDGLKMDVYSHFIGRIALEFLSLEWFITEIFSQFQKPPEKT